MELSYALQVGCVHTSNMNIGLVAHDQLAKIFATLAGGPLTQTMPLFAHWGRAVRRFAQRQSLKRVICASAIGF